jgi:hypothetical protein
MDEKTTIILVAILFLMLLLISFLAGAKWREAEIARAIAIGDRDTTVTQEPVDVSIPDPEPITVPGVIVDDPRLNERIDSLTRAIGDLETAYRYLAEPFEIEFRDSVLYERIRIDPITKTATRLEAKIHPVRIYIPNRLERIYVPIQKQIVRRGTPWYYDVRLYTGGFALGYIAYHIAKQ